MSHLRLRIAAPDEPADWRVLGPGSFDVAYVVTDDPDATRLVAMFVGPLNAPIAYQNATAYVQRCSP